LNMAPDIIGVRKMLELQTVRPGRRQTACSPY
jgi:hypothetical protein